MTLVAISASYGAGGTVIGPELAQRLGVTFVDRAIPLAVAEELDVPLDDAEAHDEEAPAPSWLDRLLRGFTNTDASVPAPIPPSSFTSEDFRRATEHALLRQAETGSGVILGRGSVIVLRDRPKVLRVRLDGPRERRIEQAMRLGNLDQASAQAALERLDRTHAEYARLLYRADLGDPSLYHLVIDSTALQTATCVQLIAEAAQALGAQAAGGRGRTTST
ncbi:MAG TPA: cytidylate kinase-like family protein [Solirubrobacteraceae bacterium]|jgi:cytidylate kinase